MKPRTKPKKKPGNKKASAKPHISRLKIFFRDHLELLLIIFFISLVSLLFFSYLNTPRATFASTPYSDLLFQDDRVHKIEIKMSSDSRTLQLSAPEQKNKYLASVNIDGETLENVTINTRGNASLETTAVRSSQNKYSYKLSFSRLDKNLSYHGLDKLILNPAFNDPSYLREYLAYTIMRESGVPAPLISYAEVYINGEPQGLYLAVEDMGRSFLSRSALPASALFKPETTFHNISSRRLYQETGRLEEITTIAPDGSSVPLYLGADLVYRGENRENYKDIFENSIIKYSPKEEEYIIRCIKSLQDAENISSCWDYNALAKYFSAHIFIINRDSYIGSIAHNYYLLLSNHRLSFLPWDYNYAFLGFTIDGETIQEVPEETSIFDPISNIPESDRPLWTRLKNDPAFLDLYVTSFENILSNYIDNGLLSEKITATSDLIRRHVAADPNRLTTLTEFDDSITYLKNFIHARSRSVQRQLWEYKEKDDQGIIEEENLSPEYEKLPSEEESIDTGVFVETEGI